MKDGRLIIKDIFESEIVKDGALVKGWIKSVRKTKKFSFVVINDGSCFDNLQIIADGDLSNYEEISTLLTGSSVSIRGNLVKSGGKGQSVEMQAKEIEIISACDESYPLQKKAATLEFLREKSHLRSRTNTFGAVFRVRSALSFATHQFFKDRGFTYLHTPIITGSDCEGAGEMFRVTTLNELNPPKNDKGEIDYTKDYFGKSTNLTVSGQLEAETFAIGMGSVYTFGPTFRAENSNTTRHASEFWMIEPEVAFADLEDIAELAGDFLKYLIDYVLKNNKTDMEFLQKTNDSNLILKLEKIRDGEFQSVTYTEAIKILQESGQKFEYKVDWGVDLQTEHERFLTEKHFLGPLIVTDYPKEIKAFYMKSNDDNKTVRAMDVLVPGVGEIIGGSQREDRFDVLKQKIIENGQELEDYWWYLDLRKYGSVPHSGFGLGFERAIMYITGMQNIRDVIPFPRTPNNAEF